MSSSQFAKRERDKAKRERAKSKRERREARRLLPETADDAVQSARSQAEVLADLAALHDARRDGLVDDDDFEAAKAELTAELGL